MDNLNTYPSKVMLVGEYGVMAGGSALTIPFRKFHARVRKSDDIPDGRDNEAIESIKHLRLLYNYICDIPVNTFHAAPDLSLFSDSLERYWLDMTIPAGYGLGSSGAISAAIYDLFFPGSRNLSLSQQKEDLAAIESHFHGKSSGVDALTCFIGKSLYFKDDGNVQQVDFNPGQLTSGYRFFLLDSGVKLETGPLVRHFLKQMEDPGFASSIKNEYLIINKKLIEALLGTSDADPGLLVRVLSDYQYTHFPAMIPDSMLNIWIEGQVTNEFYLKLNGSGGGYMLGITHQTSTESLNERWNSNLIWIK